MKNTTSSKSHGTSGASSVLNYTHTSRNFAKSHGTIIDNLSDYSEDKKELHEAANGDCESKIRTYLRVPEEFLAKFPDMSEDRAEVLYNRYLGSLRHVLLRQLPYLKSNFVHLSLNKLWDMGFQYNNNRHYLWKEFKDLRPFFMVIDDKKGTGFKRGNPFEKNSEVYIMNQKLIDLLIETASAEELVQLYYGDLTEDQYSKLEPVPIDLDSLENFLISTKKELDKADKNSKLENKLCRNYRQAKYIKLISEFFYPVYGRYVLPQIPKPSPYGRVYYRGINMQNITKEVRSAVLGDHYVYDLHAAVYAIKMMLAKQIMSRDGISDFGYFTYTKEYLDWKTVIRERLSSHIKAYGDGEKLVKEAITAIGFGARIGGGSWLVDGEWHTTSIEDIIMNPVDRHNFMNDPWIREFVREQQFMTKIIAEDFIKDKNFCESVIDIPNMFKNGRIRKSQVMSYIFQHTEKKIMDLITQDLPVIARVHDSFITLKKLTNEQLLDIRYLLNTMEPLMTINCEHFRAWINVEIIDEEAEHKERIRQEEQKARQVRGNTPGSKKSFNRFWEKREEPAHTEDHFTGYGYDGSEHNHYHESDISEMTPEEKRYHRELMGMNKLPAYVSKLINKGT